MCSKDCSCRFSKTYSKYKLSFVGKCDKFERFIKWRPTWDPELHFTTLTSG